jgi:hypothetical protein
MPTFVTASPLDCEKVSPSPMLEEKIKVDAKAAANTLFRLGKLDGAADVAIEKLYEDTTETDKSHVNSSLLYFYCGLLNERLSNDPEKAEQLLKELVEKLWIRPVTQEMKRPVYKLSRSPACGDELYKSGVGPQCGAIYNKRRGSQCGVVKSIPIRDLGYKSGNKTRYCIRFGYSSSDGGKPNGRCLLYKECRHSDFGTSGNFKTCRNPDFGVEKYKQCRNLNHGVERYE